jgi:hypothetical protein
LRDSSNLLEPECAQISPFISCLQTGVLNRITPGARIPAIPNLTFQATISVFLDIKPLRARHGTGMGFAFGLRGGEVNNERPDQVLAE